MNYKLIQNLIEDLSIEFVLSDPETLVILLPILKKIKEETEAIPDEQIANDLLKLQDEVVKNIESASKDTKKFGEPDKLELINKTISEMKSFLHDLEYRNNLISDHDSAFGLDESNDNEKQIDRIKNDRFEKISTIIKDFSKLISGFCPGEIVDLGAMLNILDELIKQADACKAATLLKVATGCKKYIERMTLEELDNTKPIEGGLTLLKAAFRHLKKGAPFTFETDDVLGLLSNAPSKQTIEPKEPANIQPIENPPGEESIDKKPSDAIEKISEDDMEILVDFVSEAEENLDTIEVNLIELEQDPTNNEIINDIFRPFHTIKGVSGFLSLTKINTLAHTTENLLDSARSGEFIINDIATDAILESVDMLKKLISRVKTGIENGVKKQDQDIDVNTLKSKLQSLQLAFTNGEKEPIGEILVRKGVVDKQGIDKALEIQKDNPHKKIGEILVEKELAAPKEIASALLNQKTTKRKVATQVKVSTEKLDDLVDYAGELVIAQSMLRQRTAGDQDLSQSVTQLGQIVTHMQNIAMSMRMIPIKATFMKMIRLVRDLSKKSGKEINLNMAGEDTEIDRNVVDALYEPMVHMIRNSCDHGIEVAQDREKMGKPSKGSITLRAYHKGGHIIIEIEDDGKGLDQMVILEKAKETGLIDGTEQLTDAQIYDLIMQPGFSTAKAITDVSGRGVGMDVVRSGIEKFRGQLNIESKMGKGTKFTISLPLTLAIIDGMLVQAGDEKYVIPTTAIHRAFKPNSEDCYTVEGKGEMIKERDQLIPLIRIKNICGDQNDSANIWESLVIVVESKGEQRGLLVDELLGKDEYVIKSLGSNLEHVEGLAGGAILADGRVGLILDVYGVFNIVSSS